MRLTLSTRGMFSAPLPKFFFKFHDVLVFITQLLLVFLDNCFEFYDALVNCLGFCFKVLDELSCLA
jgi:hypothetical protein